MPFGETLSFAGGSNIDEYVKNIKLSGENLYQFETGQCDDDYHIECLNYKQVTHNKWDHFYFIDQIKLRKTNDWQLVVVELVTNLVTYSKHLCQNKFVANS